MGDYLVLVALEGIFVDLGAQSGELVEPKELGSNKSEREHLTCEMTFPEGEQAFFSKNGGGALSDALVLGDGRTLADGLVLELKK